MTKETGMLVQKLRLQHGWSQEDLAELCALSVRTIPGMTMNERLWEAGLMDEWEAAAAARDRDRMLLICARVGIADGPTGRSWIVDTVLANPARYGF